MSLTCKICGIISSGDILADGDKCCVVDLGDGTKVATLKYHADRSLIEELREAYILLDAFRSSNSVVLEYLEDEGHWGIYSMEFKGKKELQCKNHDKEQGVE